MERFNQENRDEHFDAGLDAASAEDRFESSEQCEDLGDGKCKENCPEPGDLLPRGGGQAEAGVDREHQAGDLPTHWPRPLAGSHLAHHEEGRGLTYCAGHKHHKENSHHRHNLHEESSLLEF